MSNDVYFNEPGYSNEIGTPEGEERNNAYRNFVKYGNLKYAMIEQLKNPAKGFESVIKASFYLKKEAILRDVAQWVEEADSPEVKCDYTHSLFDW
jgi:hypothetical protein